MLAAFFRAPSPIELVSCAGDKMAVSCQNFAVLTLHAPWLTAGVLQLWPLPPIFHSRMPAAVHASSVDLAMLLLKPISPEDTTTSKEPGLYLPTPHRRHALTPVALEYAPAENLPASHALQVEATVAPTAAEYLPAPQSAQLEEPAVAWNLPAGHDVHAAA